MTQAVRYSATLQVQVQPGFRELIDKAALRRGMKPTEYMRQGLAEAVKADGFDPAAIPDRSAGALYDVLEGKQRWALVVDGQIRGSSYQDAAPQENGELWLPVVHVDSEPFDLATQWRLAPVWTIEADKVVCTYPVVAKSLEAI